MEKELRVSRYEHNARTSIIIYLSNLKYIRYLRKYGYIQYVSKKLKYVVMYIDEVEFKDIMAKLKRLKYVKDIQLSHYKEIDLTILNNLEEHLEEEECE